jgi:hypothetical protein
MSTPTLTEQLSLRLSPDHRAYLRGQVEEMKRGIPPVQVSEADVIRILIERAIAAATRSGRHA